MKRSRCCSVFAFVLILGLLIAICPTAEAQSSGGLLYVPNSDADTVSIYTIGSDGTLASAGGAISVGDFPSYVAVRRDQAYAYVSARDGQSISVIDTATQTVVQTLPISASSSILGVVISPNGSRVYVAARNGAAGSVRVLTANVNTGQLTETGTIGVGDGPRGLAISQDGSRLYVANQNENTVSVIDTGTDTVTATITVGNGPIDVALNPAGTRAYVANSAGNSVSVIDTSSDLVVATPATGAQPYGVAVTADGHFFYVSNLADNTVSVFNASTNTAVGSAVAAENQPQGIAITADGAFLYAANIASNTVSMFTIDPSTGALAPNLTASIAAGAAPTDASLCRYGNTMLASGTTFKANTAGAISCAGSSPTFTGGTLLINGAGLTITQDFSLGSGGGTINSNGNSPNFSGAFSGSDALTKVGTGTLTLSGANTYTGATTVSVGTLKAGGANTLSSGSATTVASGATLDLNNAAQTVDSISGAGAINLGSGTLTTGGANANNSISGIISGTGGLTKNGSATLTLSGVNTYTGATAVNAGTLIITAPGVIAAGGTVTVGAGATLGGNGTVNADVIFQAGSILQSGLTINGAITGAPTTTTVVPSTGTVTYGTPQTFTATVLSGGSAVTTGSVTFFDVTTSATLASNIAVNGSGQASTTKTLAAGSHTIRATYNPDVLHAGSLNTTAVTVNKAVLTVTAGDATRQELVSNPAFTATITGFVNGDTSSVVSGAASITTDATASSPAGTYAIVPSGGSLTAANYTFAFANGTLTITAQYPAPVISSVVPSVLVANSQPAIVKIRGTGFVSNSVVQVNGSERAAALQGDTELTILLNASELSSPRTLTIKVVNPEPGGGTASALISVLDVGVTTSKATPMGISTLQTPATGTLTMGSGVLTPSAGESPTPAFVRWSYRSNGVVVSEASEPAAPGITAGMFYVALNGNVNTGIAIANPSREAATVSFFFTDVTGRVSATNTFTVPAGGELAKFLNESPYNVGAAYEGTLSFSSTQPVGVVALRSVPTAGGNFQITTLPVVNLAAPVQTGIVTSPLFANGGGWITTLVLMNPTSATMTGSFQYVDKSGQAGASTTYSIPARGAQRFVTSGTGSATSTGSVRVTPATGAAPSLQSVFSFQQNGATVSESGVEGTAAAASTLAYVEIGGGAQSGLAIANTSATSKVVNLDFTVINNAPSSRHASLTLAPMAQTSLFLNQIAGFTDLTGPLQGILRVSAADNSASLAVTVLRGLTNERGDFLISAVPALPSSPYPADTQLIIPHLVTGGGYTSMVIFMNSSPTMGTMLLQTNSPSGQPLKMAQ